MATEVSMQSRKRWDQTAVPNSFRVYRLISDRRVISSIGLPWMSTQRRRCVGSPPNFLACQSRIGHHVLNKGFEVTMEVVGQRLVDGRLHLGLLDAEGQPIAGSAPT